MRPRAYIPELIARFNPGNTSGSIRILIPISPLNRKAVIRKAYQGGMLCAVDRIQSIRIV